MAHIMETKDDFYSSFENVSKSEDEKENLINAVPGTFKELPITVI